MELKLYFLGPGQRQMPAEVLAFSRLSDALSPGLHLSRQLAQAIRRQHQHPSPQPPAGWPNPDDGRRPPKPPQAVLHIALVRLPQESQHDMPLLRITTRLFFGQWGSHRLGTR